MTHRYGRTAALLKYLPAKTLILTMSQDYAALLNTRLVELGRDDITVKVIEPADRGFQYDFVIYDEADALEEINGQHHT